MDAGKCCRSIVTPGHNEFVSIWLQIIVVLFFWINFLLNLARVGIYGSIQTKQGHYFCLFLNLAFAVSATITLVYLIFYS